MSVLRVGIPFSLHSSSQCILRTLFRGKKCKVRPSNSALESHPLTIHFRLGTSSTLIDAGTIGEIGVAPLRTRVRPFAERWGCINRSKSAVGCSEKRTFSKMFFEVRCSYLKSFLSARNYWRKSLDNMR